MTPVDSEQPTRTAPPRWEQEFEAVAASVPDIRRGVSSFARDHGADPATVADIALAVTEAASNAVVHAFVGLAEGTITVVVEPGDACLLVRVIDDGRGLTPRSDSPGLGLGLPTMASLTRSCDFREGPAGRGTEVRMVFAAEGVKGPFSEGGTSDERFDLLAEVAALAEGAAWPGRGVERLVDLLVPRIADACVVDLMDDSGEVRRLGALVGGDDAGTLTRWLAARTPRTEALELVLPSLRDGEVGVVELDERHLHVIARDEAEAERMRELALAHWINLPLMAAGRLIGSVGIGLRPSRGAPGADDLAFLGALADRAASGLANTQLIEELSRTRGRLERILAALAEAVTVQDDAGHMVYANDAAVHLLGAASMQEILATSPAELAARFRITLEDGSPVPLEALPSYRLLAGEPAPPLLTRSLHRETGVERWLLTKAKLLDDEDVLVVNIIEDVTEVKEAERRQRFLAEAGELLVSTLDYQRTLEHVAGLAVPALGDWCAVDLIDEHGGLEHVALAHVDPEKVAAGEALQKAYPPDLELATGIGAVLRTGRPEVFNDITDEMLVASARDADHLEALREVGMRAAISVPMLIGPRIIGVMSFVMAESRRHFGEDDVAFALDLARRAALAVENARLYRGREAED